MIKLYHNGCYIFYSVTFLNFYCLVMQLHTSVVLHPQCPEQILKAVQRGSKLCSPTSIDCQLKERSGAGKCMLLSHTLALLTCSLVCFSVEQKYFCKRDIVNYQYGQQLDVEHSWPEVDQPLLVSDSSAQDIVNK